MEDRGHSPDEHQAASEHGGTEDRADLVGVDGHARRQADHRNPVEPGRVGDGRWGQVVVGLRRMTDQDGVDLQKKKNELTTDEDNKDPEASMTGQTLCVVLVRSLEQHYHPPPKGNDVRCFCSVCLSVCLSVSKISN